MLWGVWKYWIYFKDIFLLEKNRFFFEVYIIVGVGLYIGIGVDKDMEWFFLWSMILFCDFLVVI